MIPEGPPPRAATTGFERRASTGFSPRFGMSVTARRRAGDESPRVAGASDPGGREGPGDGLSLGPDQEAGDGPADGEEREKRGSGGSKGMPGSASGTPTTYLNARLRSQVSVVWSQQQQQRGWWERPAFLQGVLKGDPEAKARFQGRLLLLAVAFLWGSYGVIARDIFLLPHPPPVSIFTFIRKLIAASSFFVIEAFSFGGLDAASPDGRQIKSMTQQAKGEVPLDLERNGPSDSTGNFLSRSMSTSGRLSSDAPWETTPSVRDFFGGQRRLRRGTSPGRWKLPPLFLPALELGLWQFLGTASQALGLEHTSATRAGFVVQTTNVLVPIISFLSGDSILPTTWLAALLAMAGVVTMGLASEDGGDAIQAAAVVESQARMGIEQAASVAQGDVNTNPLHLLQGAQRRLLELANPDALAVQLAPIPGVLGHVVGTPVEANALALAQGPVPSSTALALAYASEGAVLGDIEVLCGAFFYSLATVRLSKFLRQHKPYALSAATMVSAAFFAGGWALYEVAAAETSGKGALSLFEGWVDQPGRPAHPLMHASYLRF